jgi:hypothetical protein
MLIPFFDGQYLNCNFVSIFGTALTIYSPYQHILRQLFHHNKTPPSTVHVQAEKTTEIDATLKAFLYFTISFYRKKGV